MIPRCDDCGRFVAAVDEEGSSWALIYAFVFMGLDREHFRCRTCTQRLGPVQSNARPHDKDMRPYQGVTAGRPGETL